MKPEALLLRIAYALTQSPARRRRSRPNIVQLEDRVAPATFVVSNTGDNSGVNPSVGAGTGTLRQAIIDANDAAGNDEIVFALPGTGVQSINLAAGLPALTDNDGVTIDGYTQPGSHPSTAPVDQPFNGLLRVQIRGNGSTVTPFLLNSSNNILRGMVINNLGFAGGIAINGSNNVIAGNFVGLNADGTGALNQFGIGLRVAGNNNRVGGLLPADRNVIGGALISGASIVVDGTGNQILGNWCGTDVAGSVVLDLGESVVPRNDNNIIGQPGAGNVILASIHSFAFSSSADGNTVQSNWIGTTPDGLTAVGAAGVGVWFAGNASVGGDNNLIGGTNPGEGNVIAFIANVPPSGTPGRGISLPGASIGNRFLGNSFYANASIGIDLGFNGITANDLGDPDPGANNLQNFPVITSVVRAGAGTDVTFSLNSASNRTYRVEFFDSEVGTQQGRAFLGAVNVTTNGSGDYSGTASLPNPMRLGFLTATATDTTTNETSEISAAASGLPRTLFNNVPGAQSTSEDTSIGIAGLSVSNANNSGTPVSITLAVGHGQLSLDTTGLTGVTGLNTGSLSFSGTVAAVNTALGTLVYTPSSNFAGTDILSFSTVDSSVNLSSFLSEQITERVLIRVGASADMPTLTVQNATGFEDSSIPLDISAALVDVDGSESLTVLITGVPAGATLSAGIDLGGGQWLLTGPELTGLTITPAAGDDADFTLGVTATSTEGPAGGTASNGPLSLSVTVTRINRAPQGSNSTVTIDANTTYVFGASDFGFSDPLDSPSDNFLAVQITTLPAAGTLTNNGIAVSAGQFIDVTHITAGRLQFAPATNAVGAPYASFTFQVQDDGGTVATGVDVDPSPNTITINVNDTIPPDTAITIAPLAFSNTSSPTFEFSGTDNGPGPLTFEYSLDAAAFVSAINPLNLTGLTEGSHKFVVRAIDAAGNVDPSPAEFIWVVDTIKPQVTIGPPSVASTYAGPVSWIVTVTEANFPAGFTLDPNDVSIVYSTPALSSTITVTPLIDPKKFRVTLSNFTGGQGTVQIQVNAGAVVDLAQNESDLATPATAPVKIIGNRALVAVHSIPPIRLAPGATQSYTITGVNTGTQMSLGTALVVKLPAYATFVPGASTPGWIHTGGGFYRMDVGNLAAKAKVTAKFVVKFSSSIPLGTRVSFTSWITDTAYAGKLVSPRTSYITFGTSRYTG